jgi:ATP-binding cassette subfamily A (ABC1) protein 3
MKYLLDMTIIKTFNSSVNLNTVNIEMQKMPYPPYVMDGLISVIQQYMPMCLMLSFILSSFQTTKNIVYEKERRLKVTFNICNNMFMDSHC